MTTNPKYKKRSDETTDMHIKELSNLSPTILFLGDSLFEHFKYSKAWIDYGFNNMNIFNAGVGGDRIQNVLYRLITKNLINYMKNITRVFYDRH